MYIFKTLCVGDRRIDRDEVPVFHLSNNHLHFNPLAAHFLVLTCLSGSPLPPEGGAGLQRLQQAVHDARLLSFCKKKAGHTCYQSVKTHQSRSAISTTVSFPVTHDSTLDHL